MLWISNKGTLVRTPAEGVSTIGRNTQGVTIIRTAEDEKVVGLQRIDEIQVPEVELDEEGNPIITAETEGQVDASTTDANDAAESDETPKTED